MSALDLLSGGVPAPESVEFVCSVASSLAQATGSSAVPLLLHIPGTTALGVSLKCATVASREAEAGSALLPLSADGCPPGASGSVIRVAVSYSSETQASVESALHAVTASQPSSGFAYDMSTGTAFSPPFSDVIPPARNASMFIVLSGARPLVGLLVASTDESAGSTSTSGVAGIAAGIVVGLVAMVGILVFVVLRRQRQNGKDSDQNGAFESRAPSHDNPLQMVRRGAAADGVPARFSARNVGGGNDPLTEGCNPSRPTSSQAGPVFTASRRFLPGATESINPLHRGDPSHDDGHDVAHRLDPTPFQARGRTEKSSFEPTAEGSIVSEGGRRSKGSIVARLAAGGDDALVAGHASKNQPRDVESGAVGFVLPTVPSRRFEKGAFAPLSISNSGSVSSAATPTKPRMGKAGGRTMEMQAQQVNPLLRDSGATASGTPNPMISGFIPSAASPAVAVGEDKRAVFGSKRVASSLRLARFGTTPEPAKRGVDTSVLSGTDVAFMDNPAARKAGTTSSTEVPVGAKVDDTRRPDRLKTFSGVSASRRDSSAPESVVKGGHDHVPSRFAAASPMNADLRTRTMEPSAAATVAAAAKPAGRFTAHPMTARTSSTMAPSSPSSPFDTPRRGSVRGGTSSFDAYNTISRPTSYGRSSASSVRNVVERIEARVSSRDVLAGSGRSPSFSSPMSRSRRSVA